MKRLAILLSVIGTPLLGDFKEDYCVTGMNTMYDMAIIVNNYKPSLDMVEAMVAGYLNVPEAQELAAAMWLHAGELDGAKMAKSYYEGCMNGQGRR